jgi:hypothetical protein
MAHDYGTVPDTEAGSGRQRGASADVALGLFQPTVVREQRAPGWRWILVLGTLLGSLAAASLLAVSGSER